MNLYTIVGARPQFIKAAMFSMAVANDKFITETTIHTGQHYDKNMSDIFFDELKIKEPDYNLSINSSAHAPQTAEMMISLGKLFAEGRPDAVLVYGDTNSTLAAAIVASKLNIPIIHVEAGLRSFNKSMPEEVNRILTDHVSSLLFAPTQTSVNQLIAEGINQDFIYNVGDIMYDAALYYSELAEQGTDYLALYNLIPKQYILCTIHRAVNTDTPEYLASIVSALSSLSSDYDIVFPLHPRTRNALQKFGLLSKLEKCIKFAPPLGYLQMLQLEKNALLIMTDSGGVQKEAFYHRVPCVTLREESEWVETINLGWNTLVKPDDIGGILDSVDISLSSSRNEYEKPYGVGDSAQQILNVIKQWFK